MEDIKTIAENIFEETVQRIPASVCIPCCNCDPGVQGGCFLRLQQRLDLGIKEEGFSTLFQPVKSLQSVSPNIVRELVCEGYNDESFGYPDGHPKQGGWVCYNCGYYLSLENSVDSRKERLPENLRGCPKCGIYYGPQADGFYAV